MRIVRRCARACSSLKAVYIEDLAEGVLGSSRDDFVIVQWTAEVGDHWIAPLPAGSAVLARRGTPHTYRNAGRTEAQYLLVMTPRIAALIEEIHGPGADIAAVFAAHDSEIVAQES